MLIHDEVASTEYLQLEHIARGAINISVHADSPLDVSLVCHERLGSGGLNLLSYDIRLSFSFDFNVVQLIDLESRV